MCVWGCCRSCHHTVVASLFFFFIPLKGSWNGELAGCSRRGGDAGVSTPGSRGWQVRGQIVSEWFVVRAPSLCCCRFKRKCPVRDSGNKINGPCFPEQLYLAPLFSQPSLDRHCFLLFLSAAAPPCGVENRHDGSCFFFLRPRSCWSFFLSGDVVTG